ncbi:MAG: hypothetical protein UIL37_02420 [Clostridia bacterium]|nr:hypothetical protein [Clostridia bacterium]
MTKAKISARDFYEYIYGLIGTLTPLKADCGGLCGGACCAVTDEITGMYLFPYENEIYSPMPSWGKIYDTDFKYGEKKYVDLFTCDGVCERTLRPLSCRIFPLVPYARPGERLSIIMDPRGKGLCPLASAADISDLDKDFVKAVRRAMLACMQVKECREFIYALTEAIDESRNII